MQPKYEMVYAVNGNFLGESIVALLKSFGIDAYVSLDTSGIVSAVGYARIYVAAAQLKDAQQLLTQMEHGKLQISPLDQKNQSGDLGLKDNKSDYK